MILFYDIMGARLLLHIAGLRGACFGDPFVVSRLVQVCALPVQLVTRHCR
jgi:hypothetical protein